MSPEQVAAIDAAVQAMMKIAQDVPDAEKPVVVRLIVDSDGNWHAAIEGDDGAYWERAHGFCEGAGEALRKLVTP